MMRGTFLLAVILLSPGLVLGATLEGQRNVVLSEAPPDNTYLAGADIRIEAPVQADLSAAGATVTLSAPVAGDALLAGGTLDIEKPIGGDLRAAGGRITVTSDISGDLSALGGAVLASGHARDIQIVGATVRVTGGASGNVTIYGGDVYLAGEYAGNVDVSASDRVSLAEGTVIHGAFRYNAPQQVAIPESVIIDGGASYTGAAAYLPSLEEAKRYALAGAGVFFLVKALAALVVAGLVAGLFPVLARHMISRTHVRSPRRLGLLALIGFALLVLTPVVIVLLTISFVGIGLALILAALYLLMLMLAYIYAGLLAGVAVLALLTKKVQPTWKAAIFGTFLLHVLVLVPVIGSLLVFLLMLICAGALARIAYTFAWGGAGL